MPILELPELQIQEGYELCFDCDANEATVYLRVANAGLGDANATEGSFVTDDIELARVSREALAAGASAVVGAVTLSTNDWYGSVEATVDPDNAIEEWDDEHNLSGAIGPVWNNDCD